jgi:hypothetical protein
MTLSLLAALLAGLAALAAALAARFGGARGQAWGFALCGPTIALSLAISLAAPWIAAVEGRVTEHGPSNRRACNLVVEGASPWRELVTPELCAACPIGAAATKPAWSFALTCAGASVETPSVRVTAYGLVLVLAAIGSAVWGARRLRGVAP